MTVTDGNTNDNSTPDARPTPALGVVFRPEMAPERLRAVAGAADEAGLDQLWLWEDCFKESGIATAAATLAWTTRIRVGIGLLPTPLRNVALTRPYMHDGGLATLSDVVNFYGDHGLKSVAAPGRPAATLDEAERADLLAFLQSLSSEVLP